MGNSEKITSREYKIMLRASRFQSTEQQAIQAASQFWQEFSAMIRERVLDTVGDLTTVDKRRTIRFYDTPTHSLRQNDYVLRERRNLDKEEREVTLKFRHPDRYIAQDRNMDAAVREDSESKFEEDIKPPFIKLYSFSTKQPVKDSVLRSLKDAIKLYPGLDDELEHCQESDPLQLVGSFTAYELVLAGASFQIRREPREEAECALVLWYDQDTQNQIPVVAEFSYKYGDAEERYSSKAARRAYRVFEALQGMKDWLDTDSQTKTAYVYGRQSQPAKLVG